MNVEQTGFVGSLGINISGSTPGNELETASPVIYYIVHMVFAACRLHRLVIKRKTDGGGEEDLNNN